MPKRDWLRFIPVWLAIGLTLLPIWTVVVWDLAYGQSEIRTRGEHEAAEHIVYAEDRIERLCLNLERSKIRDCIHEEYQTSREYARAEADLRAQEAMAKWAKLMTWVTGLGSLIGLAGLGFLYWTILENRKIGQAEVRAYLTIKVTAERTMGGKARATFKVTNSGNSPARAVTFGAGHFSGNTGTLIAIHKESLDQIYAGGDQKGEFYFNDIPEGEVLVVNAVYTDVFGVTEHVAGWWIRQGFDLKQKNMNYS